MSRRWEPLPAMYLQLDIAVRPHPAGTRSDYWEGWSSFCTSLGRFARRAEGPPVHTGLSQKELLDLVKTVMLSSPPRHLPSGSKSLV
jgi:hypothetical protein